MDTLRRWDVDHHQGLSSQGADIDHSSSSSSEGWHEAPGGGGGESREGYQVLNGCYNAGGYRSEEDGPSCFD